MRAVGYTEETDFHFLQEVHKDEQFTEREVLDLALAAIQANLQDATVIVSNEWIRKVEIVRGPLNEPSPYRRHDDDLVITLELRVDGGFARERQPVAALEALVNELLTARSDAEYHAELARLEAERDAAEAKLRAAQGALHARRAAR